MRAFPGRYPESPSTVSGPLRRARGVAPIPGTPQDGGVSRRDPFPADTTTVQSRPLAVALGACVVFIVVGTLTGGDQAALEWYGELARPEFQPPTLLVLLMSALYYIIMGVVLYRAQVHVPSGPIRRLAVALTLVIMGVNAVWNAVFMNLQVLEAAVVGMSAFVGLVLWLAVILFRKDRASFWILLPYVAWALYDLLWSVQLWGLNR